jgi:N-acetylglutamate synthase-like GNAT family acetyltransferase
MFDLSKCVVRTARDTDRDGLIAIARTIWEGHDYLPRVLDRWLAEPWFLVCEYEGRLIACLKLTMFPDKVLWFEGLRVHKRFQGKGVATMMNRHCFALASELRAQHPGLAYEFCTYYLNSESLHLTQKLGFRVVDKFYDLHKRGIKRVEKPRIQKRFGLEHFARLGHYIPCGWQSVHNTPASLAFLRGRCTLFHTPQAGYLLGGLQESEITFLAPPHPRLKEDLPYFQWFFGSGKGYNMILPAAWSSSLPLLHGLGFRFWEKEVAENMLVLAMPPEAMDRLRAP